MVSEEKLRALLSKEFVSKWRRSEKEEESIDHIIEECKKYEYK